MADDGPSSSSPENSSNAASHKELGNAYYRDGLFLKAAATYTKAIKDNPDDAVLYSNRCAALIKISKYSKALDDADTAIRLRPEWDKGYYRKASVLEAMDNQEEALVVCQHVLKMSPDNREVGDKVRNLNKLIKKRGVASKTNGAADA